MTKSTYQITFSASNRFTHRRWSGGLVSEHPLLFKGEEFDAVTFNSEAEAIASFECYCTQEAANEFTAHTRVTFYIDRIDCDDEEEITTSIIREISFEVQDVA